MTKTPKKGEAHKDLTDKEVEKVSGGIIAASDPETGHVPPWWMRMYQNLTGSGSGSNQS